MFNYKQYCSANSNSWEENIAIHYMMKIKYNELVQMLISEKCPLNILKELDKKELFLEHKIWGPSVDSQDKSDKSLLQLVSQPIPESLKESPLVKEAKRLLQFTPCYEISQNDQAIYILQSIMICTDIKAMLQANRVSYFITVEDKNTHFLAGGYNPRKNIVLENQRPDIFLVDLDRN